MSDARGGPNLSADEGDITFVETTPADDLINGRSPRSPTHWTVRPWWLAALVLAVLAAGICVGYVFGRHASKAASGAPTPTPAGSVLAELPQLQNTGSVCSVQPPRTRRLTLGLQVLNSGGAPLQIIDVQGVFPIGGLRMAAAAIGHCNDPGVPVGGNWVAAGGTAWLRVTVDVLMGCPAPAPVQFRVEYTGGGAPTSVTLAAFPDLGSVTYSGC
ncbi:MAG TPA: hypothetical protein VGJ59_18395 [Jatrophihabitantaceae bacterium]|jgi:hypothetical protein